MPSALNPERDWSTPASPRTAFDAPRRGGSLTFATTPAEREPGQRAWITGLITGLARRQNVAHSRKGLGRAYMDRLGRFDIPTRLAPAVPSWLSQIGCAVLSVAVIVLLRRLIDAVLPGIAPFALLYPGVLLATALAGWGSGLLTLALAELLIRRFLLTPSGFDLARPADAGTLVLNTLSGVLVIAVAEGFRVASRTAIRERSEKLATRELLLRELDH